MIVRASVSMPTSTTRRSNVAWQASMADDAAAQRRKVNKIVREPVRKIDMAKVYVRKPTL